MSWQGGMPPGWNPNHPSMMGMPGQGQPEGFPPQYGQQQFPHSHQQECFKDVQRFFNNEILTNI